MKAVLSRARRKNREKELATGTRRGIDGRGGTWMRERNILFLPTASFHHHSVLFSFDSTHIGEVELGVRGVGTAVGGHGGSCGFVFFVYLFLLFGGFSSIADEREE